MLFNLKEAAELGVNEGTNVMVTSRTMSSMDFAEPEIPQRCDFSGFFLAVTTNYSKVKVHWDLLGTAGWPDFESYALWC